MDPDKKADLLLAEYLHLQKVYEDFDAKALTIKAWSVTLSAAGIVAAYTEAQSIVLIVAAVSALAFWLVETLWKASQQAFLPRIREIEGALASGRVDIAPLQIATSWYGAWIALKREGKVLRILLWPHVWLPHVPVAIVGLTLFVLAPPAATGP